MGGGGGCTEPLFLGTGLARVGLLAGDEDELLRLGLAWAAMEGRDAGRGFS